MFTQRADSGSLPSASSTAPAPAVLAPLTLAPGTRVLQYEIVRLLGAGGMGEVYAAKDTQLGREVAIKVASQHVGQRRELRTRLEHEARAVAALSHPAIVAIYEFASVANRPFVVMELLRGETLRARLIRSPLEWQTATSIIAFAAEGVAAAHSKGIVHRDLKPDNLFLCDDGTVKVLDFGLARRNTLTEVATAATLTAPGMLVGTLGYMAPEQIRGDRADAPADVFALGCTLLEAITGARAFDADSAAGVLSAVLGREPAGLEQVEALCSQLAAILRRSLAKSPEDRYATAREIAREVAGGPLCHGPGLRRCGPESARANGGRAVPRAW
jgi:eukaryotic-like serine/threonine-protein kinase